MSQSIFDREWIDLVFEGRNKEYGAYKLRKDDSKTTLIALFSGIALLCTAVGVPFIIGQFSDKEKTAEATVPELIAPADDIIFEVPIAPKEEPKPEAPAPQPQTPAAPAAPSENIVALRQPEATSNEIVEPVINMDDLKNAIPGPTTTPGQPGGDPLSNRPGVTGGTGTTTTTTNGTDTGTGIIYAPDEKPDFPGGIAKFRQKVADNFNTSDIQSETTIKVTVTFVVEKDGSITNIKVLQDPGYGAGKEAIRVLKSIKTKWKPGKVKGQPVRTAYTLPIAIQVN